MLKKLVLLILDFYKKYISRILTTFLGNACRFQPTCSEYSYMAIEKHGITKGVLLTVKRVSRCHPFTKVSFDPVP